MDNTCNYVEFVIKASEINLSTDHKTIDISVPIAEFQETLRKVKNKSNIKPFNKNYKVYVKDDLYLEAEKDSEIKVFKKECVSLDNKSSKYLTLYYNKNKIPMHNFPSTTEINSVYYIDSTIFRIHNRVFLNFECQYSPVKESYAYKVFINYNHDTNIDDKTIRDKIRYGLNLLDVVVPISEIFHDTYKPS